MMVASTIVSKRISSRFSVSVALISKNMRWVRSLVSSRRLNFRNVVRPMHSRVPERSQQIRTLTAHCRSHLQPFHLAGRTTAR